MRAHFCACALILPGGDMVFSLSRITWGSAVGTGGAGTNGGPLSRAAAGECLSFPSVCPEPVLANYRFRRGDFEKQSGRFLQELEREREQREGLQQQLSRER